MTAACTTTQDPTAADNAAPATPGAPVYQLDDILGASVQNVDALLGDAILSRREGNGEYRRYALSTCSLIIILYPDENNIASVAHVDATALASQQEKPDLEACLAAG